MLQQLHDFIRTTIGKGRAGFLNSEEITDAINAASYDLWKELVDAGRKGKYSDLLDAFKSKSGSLTVSSGSATLTSQADAAITGVSIVISSEEYGTRLLHSDADWAIRKRLPNDGENYLNDRNTYTVAVADNGTKDLPIDYHSHFKTIYHQYSGNTYEGVILEPDEYLNRINSSYLAPDNKHPVATIYDDNIEMFPKPSLGTFTYILPYKKTTSLKNGFSRYQPSGSDMRIDVDPASAANVIVYYFAFPTTASHDASTYSSGEPDALTTVVETGWDDGAFGSLAARALSYLGHPINEMDVLTLERSKNINDQAISE